jgi:hypothetical protein
LRASKATTVCAAWVLAMVFSVQQGDHGPLVVYKLQLPPSSDSAAPAAVEPAEPATVIIEDPSPAPVSRARRLGPLQPTILGTVVIPAGRAPLPVPPEPAGPAPLATFGGLPLQEPAPVALAIPTADEVASAAAAYRGVEAFDDDGTLVNTETGGALTLEQVNNALIWRRETAEKLRQAPLAPRF